MNIKKAVLVFLIGFLGFSCPVWAASRSVTINVACTVAPIVQISTLRGAESNLKNSFSTVETFEKRAGTNTKILSVTAI